MSTNEEQQIASANSQAAHYARLLEKSPPVHFGECAEDRVTQHLNDLLSVLRKHKVAKFEQDGIKLEFEHSSFLQQLLDKPAQEQGRTEPSGPELGAVEPSAYPIEEVLYGAK